jgi:uncharacterized membrane protein YccC
MLALPRCAPGGATPHPASAKLTAFAKHPSPARGKGNNKGRLILLSELPLRNFLRSLATRAPELRLAVRVTSAAVLAFAIAKLLGFAHGYWAVITAIIVMQTSVGGSLKAAVDRLLGTMAGALYGAAVALLVPHGTTAELATAMVAAILPLALLAAVKPGFKVAPVTAFIVLVPLSGVAAPPLTYALERILEISIGSVVGLATALLVLPARAHHNLARLAAKAADLNAELMVSLFEGLTSDAGRPGLCARSMLRSAERWLRRTPRSRRRCASARAGLPTRPTRSRWCARSIACATTW